MPYDVEETGELTRTATVTVPESEFHSRINKTLKSLSKKVDLDGFRKGKVPLSVMRQRYGASVTREVVEELVNDHVNELIEDLGSVLYLGTPQVSEVPTSGNGELVFTVDLEMRPEVDPVGYLGLEVEKPTFEVDDEAVDAELEKLREQHAEMRPVALRQEIATGDVVTVDFQALGDHPELEQMQGDDIQIEVGAGEALPGIDEALEGAGLDATVESDIELGQDFPVEELRGEEIPVRLDIKKVEQRVLPTVDDDFALKTGEGETLLELRGNLREQIAESRQLEAERLAMDFMIDKLLEQNEFDLPPEFLEQQLQKTAEQRLQMLGQQGLDPEQLGIDVDSFKEELRDTVIKQIKTEFLLIEIARKEKIEVDEQDLRDFFDEQAQSMGVNVQQYMAFMRQNEDMMRQANATVLLEKTRKHLLSEATIEDVEWPEEQPLQDVAGDDGDDGELETEESDESDDSDDSDE